MAQAWKPQHIDTLKSWVEAILTEAEDELNDWERNFVNSISDRLNKGKPLTERQEQILERIYADKTN